MRWHTKPITQLVVMLVVMTAIVGVQQTAAFYLSSDRTNVSTPSLSAKEGGLVDVQAGLPNPTCPNTDPIQYAFTENNLAIAPPRRMRYVDAPWEYNSLNETYFTRTQDFDQAGYGTKAQNIAFMADDPNDDKTGGTQGTGVTNMMSSMFRYKPTGFKNAYILKYTPEVVRDDPSPYKGDSPAIEVPSKAGWPVCMPTTGYDIGGGYEAMVVSVDSNRITLHIGIHEYMDGRNTALGGCPPGQQCRGGYWLYVSGINVDSDIVAAYNLKKDIQQSEGLSSNITDRIQLPIVKPGRRLGTSQGDGVIVLLRDSGPIIYANKIFMWGGNYPSYDVSPSLTNTPIPTQPRQTPTPTTACYPTENECLVACGVNCERCTSPGTSGYKCRVGPTSVPTNTPIPTPECLAQNICRQQCHSECISCGSSNPGKYRCPNPPPTSAPTNPATIPPTRPPDSPTSTYTPTPTIDHISVEGTNVILRYQGNDTNPVYDLLERYSGSQPPSIVRKLIVNQGEMVAKVRSIRCTPKTDHSPKMCIIGVDKTLPSLEDINQLTLELYDGINLIEPIIVLLDG